MRGKSTPLRAPVRPDLGSGHLSLGQRVAEELRRAILEHRYKPGERLVEEALSSELGVSRIPIREALRELASEGLVIMQARRGASVASLSGSLARDLVEVRATLEGLNAKLAARHRSPPIVLELREVLEHGNRAAQSRDLDALVRLNAEFHDKLAAAGGNAILGEIMRSLRERTRLVFTANGAARAKKDWQEHSAILAAVIAGDEQAAAQRAQEHVHRAGEAALAARIGETDQPVASGTATDAPNRTRRLRRRT